MEWFAKVRFFLSKTSFLWLYLKECVRAVVFLPFCGRAGYADRGVEPFLPGDTF